MGQKSSQKEAIQDMMEKLAGVFKKYTRESRRKAWDKLTNAKGKKEVNKILTNPYRPLNQFRKLALSFKEWMQEEEGLDDFFNKVKQRTLQKFESEQGRVSFQFPNDYESIMGASSEPATLSMPMRTGAGSLSPMRLAAHNDPMLETRPNEKELGAVASLKGLNDPGWNTGEWDTFKRAIRQSASRFGAELGYLFEVEVFLHLITTRKLVDRDEFDFGNGATTVDLFEKKRERYLEQIASKMIHFRTKKQQAVDLLHHMVVENARDLGDQIFRRSQQVLKCQPDQIAFTGGEADWPDVRHNPADLVLFCSSALEQGERSQLGWNVKFTTEHKVHIASLGPLPAYHLLGGRGDQKFDRDLSNALANTAHDTYYKDWRVAVIDLLSRPAQAFQGNPKKFVALLNDLMSGVVAKGERYDTLPAVRNYARTSRGGANWSGNMQKDFIATSDPKSKLKARPDATVDVIDNSTYVKLIYHRPGGSRSGTAITFEPRSERVIVKVTNLTAGS